MPQPNSTRSRSVLPFRPAPKPNAKANLAANAKSNPGTGLNPILPSTPEYASDGYAYSIHSKESMLENSIMQNMIVQKVF